MRATFGCRGVSCLRRVALFLWLALCMCIAGQVSARDFDYSLFKRLSVREGLSNAQTYGVVQDSAGYIWFGTRHGLNRFNGFEFKQFLHDENDPDTIADNWVWNLLYDSNETLWVITWGGGVTRMDLRKDTYTHYRHDPADPASLSSNNVWTAFEDRDGTIWIGTDGGLDRLETDGTFVHYRHDPADATTIGGNSVASIAQDKSGRLWLGIYGGGISVLDKASETVVRHIHDPKDPDSLAHDGVWVVFVDSTDNIWAGSEGGLTRFAALDRTPKTFRHDATDPGSFSGGKVTAAFEDDDGRLWFGTFGDGISIFDPRTERFETLRNSRTDPRSISSNTIWKFLKDRKGTLWIATESGINRSSPFDHNFETYEYHPTGGLSAPTIETFYEDPDGILWIGTESGGLNRLDREAGTLLNGTTTPSVAPDLKEASIPSILGAGGGGLWLGTRTGLKHYDRETLTTSTVDWYDGATAASSTGNIVDMVEDGHGHIWIADYGIGLTRFDPESGQMVRFSASDANGSTVDIIPWITAISVAANGDIWFGGDGALYRANPRTGVVQTYGKEAGLIDANIVCLAVDGNDRLWVGTGSGLFRLDPKASTFDTVDDPNGGLSTQIMDIVVADNDRLWISTDNGLVRLSPDTNDVHRFNRHDGLSDDVFRHRAGYMSPGGEIMFGSIFGFSIFRPEDIGEATESPEAVLDDILVNGTPVDPSPDGVLRTSAPYATEITLSPERTTLTLTFSAPDTLIPGNMRFHVKLNGVDRDWRILSAGERYAHYANLQPGTYTFLVTSHLLGVPVGGARSLDIVIATPWWRHPATFVVYALTAMLVIYGINRLAVASHVRHVEKLQGLLTLAERANRAKTEFLGNMSHELRTPLNAILGFSEFLEADPRHPLDETQIERVRAIRSAGRHLLEIIDELLNLAQFSSDTASIQTGPVNIGDCVDDSIQLVSTMAHDRHVSIEVALDSEARNKAVVAEQRILRQVLVNLLSNAIKYSHAGGTVVIQCETNADAGRHRISVSDSGIGIPRSEYGAVFSKFEQVARDVTIAAEGYGIGLALSKGQVECMGGTIDFTSEVGVGSTFWVELPAA